MKVLYIVTASNACEFFRGQPSFMRRKGFHVGICTTPGRELDDIAGNEQADAFPLSIEREISPARDVIALWKMIALMRRFKPDVVIAGTPKAALLGTTAAFITRVPVRILVHHGLRMETLTGIKRLVMSLTERITSGLSSHAFCVSQSLRTKITASGLASLRKTTVLHNGSCNGINVANFSLNPDVLAKAKELMQAAKITPDAPVLCFVGRIVKDKGIVELAKAFEMVLKKHPHARLFVVGPEETGDPVPEKTLSYLKNHPNIHLTGYANPRPYLAMADVFVFPTYREGLPGVVLEAAAMGVPTVGACATGVVDAILDGKTGTLVPIGNADVLAAAIDDYLNDPAKRIRHGLAARRRVVRDFQPGDIWKASYDDIVRLLHDKHMEPPSPSIDEPIDIDLEQDYRETKEWLAVRDILLKGGNIASASRQFEIDPAVLQMKCMIENSVDRSEYRSDAA